MKRAVMFVVAVVIAMGGAARSQSAPGAQRQQGGPPPATKFENFRPAAGSTSILGYDDIGKIDGVSVDARELRDSDGNSVKGMLIEVSQDQFHDERAYIDVDEIPELIKGVQSLLEISHNPTRFASFEASYQTRGGLKITAFNTPDGKIDYAVEAGRIGTAQSFVNAAALKQLEDFFASAAAKLASISK